MNDSLSPTQTEFVFRRLAEGPAGSPPAAWVAIVVGVLLVGLVFIVLMYRRDCRSIRWPWAVLLGSLRFAVYGLLAWVFLLPAMQTWELVEKRSQVLLLVDVSPSMATVTDDPPAADGSVPKDRTRLDKVAGVLADAPGGLLRRLLEKNPVTLYRFGARLDEDAQTFRTPDELWDAAKWTDWLRLDLRTWLLAPLSKAGRERCRSHPAFESDKAGGSEWALRWLKLSADEAAPRDLTEADAGALAGRRAKLDARVETVRQLGIGTGVGEAVGQLLNRESGNMVQGVVLLTDGRNNLGSEAAYAEVRARAKRDRIPVFAVAVGEDRPPVSIRIADVQTPETAPPDDKFVLRVELDGEGLAEQTVPVRLDVFKPGDEGEPAHTLEATATFQPGEPPHAQVEFSIDPETLPAGLKSEGTGFKEFVEGEWRFAVRVPRDKRELFDKKEHASEPAVVQVVKKPLRVLLVTSGPMRDYQFLRTLLVREKDAKRAELSILLQNEGRGGAAVQDIEAERMLARFPTTLRVDDDPNEKPEDRPYNLANYDLIVAFDADWSELQAEQVALLQKWVDTQAGGLIVVGGPINTFQLARDDESGKLRPLRDLFPVIPGDSVVGAVKRAAKVPWRLNFGQVNPDLEYLKLDDDSKDLLSGWEEYFLGSDKAGPVVRGFFNYYPVKGVKPGAAVVATFSDPVARTADGKEHPFLVTMPYGKGRVVFVGSPELWRLRQFKEQYFERFWTKLGRFASAGTRGRTNRRGILVMGRQFASGGAVRLEAQLFGPTLEPLPRTTKPRLTVASADGADKRIVDVTPKPSQGEWGGWFQARFAVSRPGEYRIELPVPGSGDVLRGKFTVREANPELDQPRPDPATLYQLAGDLDEIKPRMTDPQALARLQKQLTAPAPAASPGVARPPANDPRLVFALAGTDTIPDCMATERKEQRNRGTVDDLWDDGPRFGTLASGQPIEVAWPLLAGVGLLSAEWLIRKLLRLA